MNTMQNIKPVYFLEVWNSPKWGLCWAMRSFGTVRAFNHHFAYHEHFYGQRATVHTGTDDFDITREQLMKCAVDHVMNNCKTLMLDLNTCTYRFIEGHPSTPDY